MAEQIRLYNTKSKTVEDFIPEKEGSVGIYSCGPTVYHYAHIGNLRAYVFADVLRRMFVNESYQVTHIINITDVGHLVGDGNDGEDKLEKGSVREGKSAWDVASYYEEAFKKDLGALNIPEDAYTFPRATEHIPEQIALIKALEEKGYTYSISDGVYFDTSTFHSYADFAHLNIEGLQSGARVEENIEKKNITDFALWKFSPKNEKRQMEWESPWGIGFPGWHIECSAMSMKYLGNHFDIHTGGIDHIPVHHTNEIAQSESVTGETYVNYWMHVNFLNDTTGKMSKSNDDFLTLDSLTLRGFDPLAYRYFLLMTHYRKEINFSFDAIDAATIAYRRLENWCAMYRNELLSSLGEGSILQDWKNLFDESLWNDIGTPSAIATIWKMFQSEEILQSDRYATLLYMSDVLGLDFRRRAKIKTFIPQKVQTLVEERNKAKLVKNYTESDRLREEISKEGYDIQDTPQGSTLSKKTPSYS